MRIPHTLTLMLLTTLLTAGCGVLYKQPIYQGNLIDKAAADQLAVGMSRKQVQVLLGTPSVADPFHQNRWDYMASQRTSRFGATDVKSMTLYFDGDSLTRWEGDYFPEQDAELSAKMRKFGNLPKDKKKKRPPSGG